MVNSPLKYMTKLPSHLEKAWVYLEWPLFALILALNWLLPSSPGMAIGLLALAAAVMSLFPNHKMAWTMLLMMLCYAEIKNIYNQEATNKAEKKRLNEETAFILYVQLFVGHYTRVTHQLIPMRVVRPAIHGYSPADRLSNIGEHKI